MIPLGTKWKMISLGKLCRIARGGSPRPIKDFITDETDGINWIKIGDTEVGGRYISSTRQKIKKEGSTRSRFVESGAFLLSNSMSFGRPYILKISGCIHDGWLVLEPDYSQVIQDYLYYVLVSPMTFKQFDRLAAGSTVRNLNIGLVASVEIPLPPLEVQQRIVAVLDEAFEGLDRARAHTEANLEDNQELLDSIVSEAFIDSRWPVAQLDELAHKDCSLSYGIVQPGDEVNCGLPIVRPTDLTKRTVDLRGLKQIDPKKATSYQRTKLIGGELLLCVRGSTGTVSIASSELSGANVTRGIVPVRLDPAKVSTRFAYFQFLSSYIQKQISEQTYGAALMQINIRELRKLKFLYPSLDEQYSVVEKLEGIINNHDFFLEACQAKLADLGDLRQSLLQRAFAGELT